MRLEGSTRKYTHCHFRLSEKFSAFSRNFLKRVARRASQSVVLRKYFQDFWLLVLYLVNCCKVNGEQVFFFQDTKFSITINSKLDVVLKIVVIA